MSLEPIDNINAQYPCSKRGGYGRSCNCTNAGPIDKGYVTCDLFGNVKMQTCTDCNYQYQEFLKNNR